MIGPRSGERTTASRSARSPRPGRASGRPLPDRLLADRLLPARPLPANAYPRLPIRLLPANAYPPARERSNRCPRARPTAARARTGAGAPTALPGIDTIR